MEQTDDPLLVPLELIQKLVDCSLTATLWGEMDGVMAEIIEAAKNAVVAQGIQDSPLEVLVKSTPPSSGQSAAIFGIYLDGNYPHHWLNSGLRDIGKYAYQQEIEEKEKSGRSR